MRSGSILYKLLTSALIAIALSAALCGHAYGGANHHSVFLGETADRVTLSNDYLELVFDRANHDVVRLAADHSGKRIFGNNLLASDGIRFDEGDTSDNKGSQIEVLERKSDRITLRISWTRNILQFRGEDKDPRLGHEEPDNPMAVILTLGAAERGVHVQANFPATDSNAASRVIHVALKQWFLLGLFDKGVVQYVAGQQQAFTSHDRLRLFYTMDRENGSIAIEPDDKSTVAETVLLSGNDKFASGIELRAEVSQGTLEAWSPLSKISSKGPSSSATEASASHKLRKQVIDFKIYASDQSFPAHHAENMIGNYSGDGDSNSNNNDREQRDASAYFTAIYGSGAGVLGSYTEPGSAYPTLATPDRPYGDAFDFFDPDAWSTVTALSYSGDPLLQREARKILERSEGDQLPDGQMPHHFENGRPAYLSIAKSSQTGPNIFWVIAASEYAAGTGDEAWLLAHYIHLRMATDWILAKYDPAHKLLRADGPLFIDVFRRNGFTLDSNVAALYLLDRMTEVAEFCGDAASAERYRSRRRDMYSGIRQELWNKDENDHFVTQKNPDGTTRDMVDYDGNFAALAFGVPDEADAKRLLHRLDRGLQTHPNMRGTWVSERRYEKVDCYGDNDGDSDTAMARIWWLDMAARVRMVDGVTFDALLKNLESDLVRDVWMPERYDANGRPGHNDYYHEYPDIITIVLREMRYGVHVGMREVVIDPFGAASFELRLGKLRVDYSPDVLALEVPGSAARRFRVGGLQPRTRYKFSTGERLETDVKGVLRFNARAGIPIHIRREN